MATNIQLAVVGGRLTRDPELKQTKSGTLITSFTIAVNKVYAGEEHSEFCEIVAYGKTAEKISKYFVKGREIVVTCHGWTTKQWQSKDGTRYNTIEFKADDFCFVGVNINDPAQTTQPKQETPENAAYLPQTPKFNDDGDLPF